MATTHHMAYSTTHNMAPDAAHSTTARSVAHKGTATLETERLTLRRFAPGDAGAMFRNWASDPDVTEFLTWPPHASVAASAQILSEWAAGYARPDCYNWAIALRQGGGEPIGSISVTETDEKTATAHIGYCIGKAWWRKGYTSEALRAVVKFLFEEVGMARVEAHHDTRNPNSGKVMAKAGLKYEGTRRQAGWNNRGVCDSAYCAILAEDYFGADAGAVAVGATGATGATDAVAVGATGAVGAIAAGATGSGTAGAEQTANGVRFIPMRCALRGGGRPMCRIEPITPATRGLATAYIAGEWQTSRIAIRGEIIDCSAIDGFIAADENGGGVAGLATYIFRGDACEIVTLNSERPRSGLGTALVERVKAAAAARGCKTLRLMTTNDNLNAMGFYQKRGFELVGVNLGAIDRERETIKPEIPLVGLNGIPLRHEICFAMGLEGK